MWGIMRLQSSCNMTKVKLYVTISLPVAGVLTGEWTVTS